MSVIFAFFMNKGMKAAILCGSVGSSVGSSYQFWMKETGTKGEGNDTREAAKF
jgi:hypothetical protein